ncbi:MAG: DNA methyltransferase [Hydrogenophilales bacterium RIFOXYD1_FULL_62_11]|nr:MAG: DNA methyltransferase [Hydrogenophilales bacterium RIFOXYD1_FULL_62_11]
MPQQLGLDLNCVLKAYHQADCQVTNDQLYRTAVAQAGVDPGHLSTRAKVGRSGEQHNLLKRKIRWYQQTARALGFIERVPGKRGVWRMTQAGRDKLTIAPPNVSLVAFSTELGVALWSTWENVFPRLEERIDLVLTSPPYALRAPRRYGNPTAEQYVDFICKALEPLVANLSDGGIITLNISNDIFEKGSPARSLYRERLVIALHDRLQLFKLDELVWVNTSKPPSPYQWSSRTRQQLNCGYEPVYVFTNNPAAARSDNRRVLQPHTDQHQRLIDRGGEAKARSSSDGAYRIKPGSYGNATAGKIPRNVITMGHRCADQVKVKRAAREAGLPVHGAAMPLQLASFLVQYLSRPGDLVADPFAGTLTTAKAAEINGRRWIATDSALEYLLAGSSRF